MLRWVQAFRKLEPGLTLIDRPTSPMACVPGVASGAYDFGFPAREVWPFEAEVFRRYRGYEPFAVVVALGAQKTPGLTPTLGVFVNAKNPIKGISLDELDAIYSSERRRGYPSAVRTWGDLGVAGDWAGRPVRAYGHRMPNGIDLFVQKVVTRGAAFKASTVELPMRRGTLGPDDLMARAVAGDPDAIGLGCFGSVVPGVKTVPVAETRAGPYYKGTLAEIRSLKYPLSRPVFMVFDRAPGQPLEPRIAAFVRFVLSPAGQRLVETSDGWIPLSSEEAARQLSRLN